MSRRRRASICVASRSACAVCCFLCCEATTSGSSSEAVNRRAGRTVLDSAVALKLGAGNDGNWSGCGETTICNVAASGTRTAVWPNIRGLGASTFGAAVGAHVGVIGGASRGAVADGVVTRIVATGSITSLHIAAEFTHVVAAGNRRDFAALLLAVCEDAEIGNCFGAVVIDTEIRWALFVFARNWWC